MPLAGRLADLWGARRLLLLGLVAFTVGSALAGASQGLGELIGARLVQAFGGGIIVPVATAAAAHLYAEASPAPGAGRGRRRSPSWAWPPARSPARRSWPRSIRPRPSPTGASTSGPLLALLAPAWRWVFYLNVPIGLVALVLAWAATGDWDTPRRSTGDRPARRRRVHASGSARCWSG